MSRIKDFTLLQEIFGIFEKLGRGSIQIPIIVEGKKDKMALEEFGISNVYTLSGSSLSEIPKKISSKRAIILTDYDQEGKKLAARLSFFLEKEGVTPILRFKAALGRLLKVTEIESIPKFIENLRGGYFNGKDKSYCRKIYNSWSNRSGWSCRGT